MDRPKVLIVEDNRDLAHAMELRLQASGYEPLVAGDGPTALRLALAERPFAVILDLSLPNSDGVEVLKRLHSSAELSALPVVVVTADHSATTKKRVLEAGANSFLEKPFDHSFLLATLRAIESNSTHRDGAEA